MQVHFTGQCKIYEKHQTLFRSPKDPNTAIMTLIRLPSIYTSLVIYIKVDDGHWATVHCLLYYCFIFA